jgi:hypothetical protein
MDNLYAGCNPESFTEEARANYAFPEKNKTVDRYVKFNSNSEWDPLEFKFFCFTLVGSHFASKAWAEINTGGDSIRLGRARYEPRWRHWGLRAQPFLLWFSAV